MRLNRLGLTAFGKFTNAALDFGDRPANRPDLHIIYGPNEAGKSTIYAAMLDFFFGIQQKSSFNFKHPYEAMRIEGTVATDAGVTALARIKRRNNDLLDGADQPVSLNPFAAGLAGLDRDSYAAMFSLNEASLTEGGKSLLAAEGDFGRILYGASAGLTDFGGELDAVREEIDAFHKERARKTNLRALTGELEGLAKQKAEIDTLAPEYEALIKARSIAAGALVEAETAEHAAQKALSALQNKMKALDYLSEYKELQEALAPLEELPEAPAGLDVEVTRLREEAASLNAQSADATQALKTLEEKIGIIIVDEAALGQRDAFAALADLAGRHRADADDLPRRIEERTGLLAQIAARSERMVGKALEDANALLLPPGVKGRVLELADAWPPLQTRLQSAEAEVETAASETSADRLDIATKAELEAALQAYETDDANARAEVLADTVATRQRAVENALASLAPWTGDITALRQIQPPSAQTLNDWRQSLDETAAAIKRAAAEASEAAERAAEKRAQLDAISLSIQSIDDASFMSVMRSRDEAWSRHRAALDDASADAFAKELEKTDAAQAARFSNASAVANEAAAQEAMAIARAQEAAAKQRGADLKTAQDQTQSNIKKYSQASELENISCLSALEGWLAARVTAIAEADSLDATKAQQQTAERAAERLQQRFIDLLDINASLPALASLARSKLEADKAAQSAAQNLAKRTEALEKSRAEVAEWRAEWSKMLDGTWMTPLEASVQSVKAALVEHDALSSEINALEGLQRRIGGIEDNLAAFKTGLSGILKALDETLNDREPLQVHTLLQDRIKAAETQNAERIRLQAEIDAAADRRRTLEAKLSIHKSQVEEAIKIIDASDLLPASQLLAEIENRNRLREKTGLAGRAILDRVGGDDIAAAVASLQGLDRNSLAADLEAANSHVRLAKDEALQSYTANRDAGLALDQIGGDAAAVEIAQRRQTVIEDIADGAKRYLRLKLGAMAAADALEQYRASHQSGMLVGASSAFAEITEGAYLGLKTQTGGKGEELIALAADGASRLDDKSMSTGTRAQLYLALRVAAYHEFAGQQTPPPFVADDIFETFDDGRAEVTFSLLGDMATKGQVIYFTHHQHLKPIAERAVPNARWQDLTALL